MDLTLTFSDRNLGEIKRGPREREGEKSRLRRRSTAKNYAGLDLER